MKLIWFSLAILVPLSLFSQVDKSNYSLLWEITGKGLEKPSYLFGTMHVQDERAHEFSDSTLLCLDATEAFVMEINIDSIMSDFLELYLKGDTTNVLKERLSPEAYDRLNERIKNKTGQHIEEMDNKDPQYLEGILTDWDEPEYTVKKEQVVDLYLMKRAVEQGHKNYGLEKMEDYLNASFSYFDLFENKESEVKNDLPIEAYHQGYEKMIKIYQSGDLTKVEEQFVDKKRRTQHDIEMLDNRNVKMVANLEKLMQQYSVFCAVGTAHLPGEFGMLETLKKRGYRVRKVEASFTGVAKDYKKTITKNWDSHENKSYLFKVKAPGPPIPINEIMGEDITGLGLADMHFDMLNMTAYAYMVMDITEFLRESGVQLDTIHDIEKKILEKFSSNGKESFEDAKKVTRSGIKGKRISTVDEEGSIISAEIFIRNNLFYMFFIFKESGKITEDLSIPFFNSIEFTEKKWEKFRYPNAAFSADFPMQPKVKRNTKLSETYDDQKREIVYYTYTANDPITDVHYLIRSLDTGTGLTVHSTKERSLSTLNAIVGKLKMISGPDSMSFKGYPAYKAIYSYQKTILEAYTVNRGNRDYLILMEYQKANKKETDRKKFLESIEFLPYEKCDLFFNTSTENYAIDFPEKVVITSDSDNEYPIISRLNYMGNDSLNSGAFQMEVYSINPYFTVDSTDNYFLNFYKKNYVNSDSLYLTDTVFQGHQALYSREKYKTSENQSYNLSFYYGTQVFELFAILPNELEEAVAWDFFNSFQYKGKEKEKYIFDTKQPLLLNTLLSKDSTQQMLALQAMNYELFSTKDLPSIYQLLNKNKSKGGNKIEEVKKVLLRELGIHSDDQTLSFLEEYFYHKKTTKNLQETILTNITKQKNKKAFDLFFKLAPLLKKDKNEKTKYLSFFDPLQDTMALSQQYIDQLLNLNQTTSLEYTAHYFLGEALYDDSTFQEVLAPYVPKLVERAEIIIENHKLLEAKDSIPKFKEYLLLRELHFCLKYYPRVPSVNQYFSKVQKIPAPLLTAYSVDALCKANLPVERTAFDNITKYPRHWYYLLDQLNKRNSLSKVPDDLLTPDQTVHAIAADVLYNEYGTLTNYNFIETRDYSFKEEKHLLYIFTFGIDGYEGQYLGICQQPPTGIDVKGKLSYMTKEYSPDLKEEHIQKIIDFWQE